MAFDVKWLHAQINLAWRVVVHYARALWPWAPRYGLLRFQQNYVVEGLAPTPIAQRDELAFHAGRCTGCGACDDACPALLDNTDFMGPHAFVVAGARTSHLLDDVKASLAILASPTCGECQACDNACPQDIPITTLAIALEAQRVVVENAKAGKMPILPKDVRQGLYLPPHAQPKQGA